MLAFGQTRNFARRRQARALRLGLERQRLTQRPGQNLVGARQGVDLVIVLGSHGACMHALGQYQVKLGHTVKLDVIWMGRNEGPNMIQSET